jgi:uncharacterized membrane protein YdjX (TVP38/TMEM64 family)
MRTKNRVTLLVIALVAAGLTALWRWTALADWFSVSALTAWGREFEHSTFTPLWVLLVFLIAGQVFFPITVLSLATVLAFGPVIGTVYSTAGALLAGVATYFLGRLLGEDRLCSVAGPRLKKLRAHIQNHGLATSVTIHILPVAPFTLVNLFSGASGLRLRDFILGTLIGHLPGAVSVIVFHSQLRRVLRSPNAVNVTVLALVVAALSAAVLWAQAQIRKKTEGSVYD